MNDAFLTGILQQVKTIAVAGASDKPDRPVYHVMEYLLGQGYRVIPVNPKLAGKTLIGQLVYATLADIPEPVDMVDVFRNADAAPGIAEEAIAVKAKVLWLQQGIVSSEAKTLAENAGLLFVEDRCPKIEIPRLGLEK
ncbi:MULTISPECIES: CoA-binding protein [Morganella]|uniref:CoA-binding protein n=1 Tax=Morganella TaxID=581 RepID=UPI000D1DB056|nr:MULTISPECIES: CoA-binding protein [Morganella]BEP22013.1 CoA-binding protein [Morganella morganii subsp. sibonii]HDS6841648.1 CoA-binding protein [Morganella morganii subsp. morganii]EGT3621389.1 CoA-binding protein [Morganella morganii]EGT3630795.1 CoA-binding protein [Morganella morganii]EGT3634088.1 CoA-binding protein [Morganella morganii]